MIELKKITILIRDLEKPKKRGFAMLFSVLISSLLVVVGLSIFNITLKELTISTSGRESQIAFYAANSGMECALYWDLKGNRTAFATSTSDIPFAKVISTKCGNLININSNVTSSGPNYATTNFSFNITNDTNPPCVEVMVEKYIDTANGNKPTTIIKSQGNNICSGGRRVQRGLQATIIK